MDFGESWEIIVLLSWASVIEVCLLSLVRTFLTSFSFLEDELDFADSHRRI